MSGEELAGVRVAGSGYIQYISRDMDDEEKRQRRYWMRKILKDTGFANASNNQLDGMRLWKLKKQGCYMLEDENGYEFYLPGAKISKEDADFRRMRSMMPFEYINLTAGNFDWIKYGEDVTRQKEIVNKFVVNFQMFSDNGMGLYIFSETKGSGKTMLSCCILNELSKRYAISVKFVNALDFLEMTKKGFNYDNPDVEALYTSSVLVLDDIGVQMSKEWVDTVFYRLINTRYNEKLVTIYTSNIAVGKLKMDERITGRIESRSYEIHLPEVPVRSVQRKAEKDELLNRMNQNAL
ncbi:MAG: ATP-binding protein [Dorea sp.]